MGKQILENPLIEVDGVDLSNKASQVEITDESEEVDVTGFGAKNRETLLGLGDASINVSFFQDFASGSVDATLHALQGSNDPFEVKVRNDKDAAKSATNPEWTLICVLPTYQPLSGSVGEASTIEATFRNADATGLIRDPA